MLLLIKDKKRWRMAEKNTVCNSNLRKQRNLVMTKLNLGLLTNRKYIPKIKADQWATFGEGLYSQGFASHRDLEVGWGGCYYSPTRKLIETS